MTLVTVLGGGQLGRMLGLAGIPLGLSFTFLDPSPDAPAAIVGDLVVGGLDDVAAARRAAKGAAVVTYEWEGVPAETARALEGDTRVLPSPRALEVSQDRLIEKDTFRSIGYPATKVQYLVNRADSPGGISPDDLQRALGRVPEHRLVSDGQLVVRSNNEGVPFILANPGAPVSQDIARIASALMSATREPVGAGRS